jgi:hypothetical protein
MGYLVGLVDCGVGQGSSDPWVIWPLGPIFPYQVW